MDTSGNNRHKQIISLTRRENTPAKERDSVKDPQNIPSLEYSWMWLVRGTLGLAVLGLIAYLITKDVTVLAIMNSPLLAVIAGIIRRFGIK